MSHFRFKIFLGKKTVYSCVFPHSKGHRGLYMKSGKRLGDCILKEGELRLQLSDEVVKKMLSRDTSEAEWEVA
jgi:hypothetical protein